MRRGTADVLLRAVHELRDPIAVIMGYARILGDPPPGSIAPRVRREAIASLERSARQLVRSMDVLSDLANLENDTLPFNWVAVPLATILDRVAADVATGRPAGAPPIEIRGTAARARIRADPTRLSGAIATIVATAATQAGDGVPLVMQHARADVAGRDSVTLAIGDRAAVAWPRARRSGASALRLRLDGELARRVIEAHGGRVYGVAGGAVQIEMPARSRRRSTR